MENMSAIEAPDMSDEEAAAAIARFIAYMDATEKNRTPREKKLIERKILPLLMGERVRGREEYDRSR